MNVFAKFYDRMIKTDAVNPQTGLPIFKEVCFVEIRIKNNTTDVVDQPATEEKKRRFQAEYQLYLQSKEKEKAGTPLSVFAFLTLSEQETLKSHGIFTIEEFVSLPEERVADLSLNEEFQKAKEFLEVYKNQQLVSKLKEEISSLKQEIFALKSKLVSRKRQVKNKNSEEVASC